MSILYLIASGNFISVNRDLIKAFGIETAILIGELASEYEYYAKRDELIDGCFYSTVRNIKENTGLSEYQQRQAFKVLQNNGIVEILKKGLPAKRYVKINEQVFLDVYYKWRKNYSTGALKIKALDVENLSTNNNIIKKNIINKVVDDGKNFDFDAYDECDYQLEPVGKHGKNVVYLSTVQYDALIEKFGNVDTLNRYIEKLANYIIEKHDVKNHYETLISWYEKDMRV